MFWTCTCKVQEPLGFLTVPRTPALENEKAGQRQRPAYAWRYPVGAKSVGSPELRMSLDPEAEALRRSEQNGLVAVLH